MFVRVRRINKTEVLNILESLDVKISAETLRRWTKAGLVSEPLRGSRGRGKGRYSDYSQETVNDAFAAYHLLKNNSMDQVSEVRQNAKGYLADYLYWRYEKDACAVYDKYPDDYKIRETGKIVYVPAKAMFFKLVDKLVIQWLICYYKADCHIPDETFRNLLIWLKGFEKIEDGAIKRKENHIVKVGIDRFYVDYTVKVCESHGAAEAEGNPDGMIYIIDEYYKKNYGIEQGAIIALVTVNSVLYKEFGRECDGVAVYYKS